MFQVSDKEAAKTKRPAEREIEATDTSKDDTAPRARSGSRERATSQREHENETIDASMDNTRARDTVAEAGDGTQGPETDVPSGASREVP